MLETRRATTRPQLRYPALKRSDVRLERGNSVLVKVGPDWVHSFALFNSCLHRLGKTVLRDHTSCHNFLRRPGVIRPALGSVVPQALADDK